MNTYRFAVLFFCAGICFMPQSGTTQDIVQSQEISLDDLLNVEISTASKYDQKANEAPASITIITSEDIERYGYRTLEEVFQNVRGFYVSDDRNYGYLGARGFSRPGDYNNRILVLINGQTANEPFFNAAAISTDFLLSLDVVERIEIVRGPGSALYGTSAMFGVVNIITKKSATFEGLRLSGEKGSYGRLIGSAGFGKGFDNGLEISVFGQYTDIKGQDLYYQEYDDPYTNNGIAEDLDWDRYYNFLTTISYKNFELQAGMNSREKGIPTGAWEMAFNHPNSKTLDEYKIIQLKYDNAISAEKNIMLRGFFDQYHAYGTYPWEAEEDGESYIYDTFEANDVIRLGGEFQFRWDLRSNSRLIVGADYQNVIQAGFSYWDEFETYFDDDFPFNVLSLYLQEEYQATEKLSFTGGIRWDRYSDRGSAFTPRAAIIYNPKESATLKLLYGEAFRVPSLYEINYEDPGCWKKPTGLVSEKIRTIELAWEQRLSESMFGVISCYNYQMNNLIEVEEDPTDFLPWYQNASKVSAFGFELGLQARFTNGVQGYANYAFQKADDGDTHERLSNSPSHLVKMGLSCRIFNHFHVAAQLLYESDRITVYETKTDPYLLTNLNFSTNQLFGHIGLSFKIRNLFDVEYRYPGGFEHLQPGIIQNGRNFIARLEFTI